MNGLTVSTHCATSKQPELKHAAVAVGKADLPWRVLAMAWVPADAVLSVRQQLHALAQALPYAACVPFAGADPASPHTGVLLRAAAAEPMPELLAPLRALLGLDAPDTLKYEDPRRGQWRAVRLQRQAADERVSGLLLAGDTRAEAWMRTLLQEARPAQALRRQLLAFGAQAPAGVAPRARTVCQCVGVGEDAIVGQLQATADGPADARLAALQQRLRCGTECGSCVPELRRLVRITTPVPAAA